MGMYDELKVNKKWLPKELENYEEGWQTKSLEQGLDLYQIDVDGELRNHNRNELVDYIGEIEFHKRIENVRWEFKAWCVNGQVKEVIKIS